jgi:metal-responsive CopG/Arc/MetJ family transcriptional regulator
MLRDRPVHPPERRAETYLPADARAALDEIAERNGMSRSGVLRVAVLAYLREHGPQDPGR